MQLSQSKKTAEEQLTQHQLSVKDFRLSVFWLAADTRKVSLRHGNLGKMLLEEEMTRFFASWLDMIPAAAEGAISIAEKLTKFVKNLFRVILNSLGKTLLRSSRINGFTYVETEYDPCKNARLKRSIP